MSAAPGPRRRVLFERSLLALWGAGALVLSAFLLGSHLVALPAPRAVDVRLAAAVTAYGAAHPGSGGLMLHALYEDCKCSQNVVEHLIARGAHAGHELVLLVAEGVDTVAAQRLRAAGFDTHLLSADALRDTYGIEAAPALVVADATGVVRYVGGYGDRKQSPILRDVEIDARIAQGEVVAPLPLFGCAVSEQLRSSLDPLGLTK